MPLQKSKSGGAENGEQAAKNVAGGAAARVEAAAAGEAAAAANTSYLIIQRPHEPSSLEKGQRPSFLSQTFEFSVSFYSNFF